MSDNSFGGRILGSFVGVLFALLLVPSGVVLLFWNEGRAVKTAKSFKEGEAAVVAVASSTVDAANDHKLVHVTGQTSTDSDLHDPMFPDVGGYLIRLKREVLMYQWKENKNTNSNHETSYTYEKSWERKLIDSSDFKYPEGHTNPKQMLPDLTQTQGALALDDFNLPMAVITKMPGDVPVQLTDSSKSLVFSPITFRPRPSPPPIYNNAYYLGKDPTAPQIGDQEVRFTQLGLGTFSVVAMQSGRTFASYPTHAGRDLLLVEQGDVDAASMFQHAETNNKILTWVLRVVGVFLLNFGFMVLTFPGRAMANFIPFLGGIVGFAFAVASFLLSLVVASVTVSIAWITYRPLIGGSLLAIAVVWLILLSTHLGRQKAVAQGT